MPKVEICEIAQERSSIFHNAFQPDMSKMQDKSRPPLHCGDFRVHDQTCSSRLAAAAAAAVMRKMDIGPALMYQ